VAADNVVGAAGHAGRVVCAVAGTNHASDEGRLGVRTVHAGVDAVDPRRVGGCGIGRTDEGLRGVPLCAHDPRHRVADEIVGGGIGVAADNVVGAAGHAVRVVCAVAGTNREGELGVRTVHAGVDAVEPRRVGGCGVGRTDEGLRGVPLCRHDPRHRVAD